MEISHKITFALAQSGAEYSLDLEQEDWKYDVAEFTKAELYAFLYGTMMGIGTTGEYNCGLADDNTRIYCNIYAYPNSRDLEYTLKTTYGSLGDRVEEDVYYEESVSLDLDNTIKPKYKAIDRPTIEWVGTLYDSEGNVTPKPKITIKPDEIALSKKVYGSAIIKYNYIKHTYVLDVPLRKNSEVDLFGSVVYALYEGGVSWLDVSAPPGADDIASGAERCKWTNNFSSEDIDPLKPEYKPPTSAPKVNREIKYDYCSGDLLSDTVSYE